MGQGKRSLGIGVLGVSVGCALLLFAACGPKTKHNDGDGAGAASGEAAEAGSGHSAAGRMSAGGSASSNGTGGSATGGSASGGGEVTDFDSFVAAEVHALCDRIFRCNEADDDIQGQRFVFGTAAGCEAEAVDIVTAEPSFRDLREQVGAGTLHVVPAAAQKCVEALSACYGLPNLLEGPCLEAFDGNRKTGEECYRTEECAGDAYCASGDACPGKCAPRPQVGEICELGEPCSPNDGPIVCDSATSTCEKVEQTARAKQGQPCTRRVRDQLAPVFCEDDVWCATAPGGDPATDEMGVCAPPIAGTGACQDGDDVCAIGFCDTTAGACHAVTMRKKVGEACDRSAFTYCDSNIGLYCDTATGKCIGSGDGSAGSVCFSADLQKPCNEGLYCKRDDSTSGVATGTCTTRLASAVACEKDDACSSGFCEGNVCQARGCF
jgi:hypothetical protein